MGEQEPVPFPIHGRNGVELGEFWLENRFHAYQGVSVCGFPNMFSVMGPYGFVVGSYFWMIEATTRHAARVIAEADRRRSEEHTSELQSLMRISYAVFCLKKNNNTQYTTNYIDRHI